VSQCDEIYVRGIMAKKEKISEAKQTTSEKEVDDFTSQLIKDLNKEAGVRVAYNLSENEAPTIVKRWLKTGSIQLDYAIRNAGEGGYPEGRVIEITGLPSCGKSHLAYHACANVQALGGLVIYIDTENATPVDKLQQMGINVRNRFVYVDEHCTENVFKVIESTILKAKQVQAVKDVPILVVWDSIAQTSPKAELDGEYDQNTMGLQARVLSKGMRKITGVIGQNNITLLCLNQLRENIGVMHGDPYVSPGGKAIPYAASVRVRLGSGSPVKDKNGNIIGAHVTVSIKKNKVAPPFKKCEFDIIFGKGIVEHEYLFDEVRGHCDKNKVIHNGHEIKISGSGSWKQLMVSNIETGEVIVDKKFYKAEFGDVLKDPAYNPYIMKVIDEALTLVSSSEPESSDEHDSDDDSEMKDD
jgi:recombination protein RecA